MRIALIGNQNSGKTTLFNHLTGYNQKIGNWPGVTLEKKVGILRTTKHEIIDLPGIYSLAPYSEEEKIVRKFLLEEHVDLIINIVDSTAIERSLYLTTQLLEFNIPMIIALNMSDLAFENGIKIDTEKLSELLDTTVIPISALKKTGIKDLILVINKNEFKQNKYRQIYDEFIQTRLNFLTKNINFTERNFIAVKALENDELFELKDDSQVAIARSEIEKEYDKDINQVFANERYKYVEGIRDATVSSIKAPKTTTEKIDKILLNKWFAIPIFIVIMFLIYFISAGPVGQFLTEQVDTLIGMLKDWTAGALTRVGASDWSNSLVVEGIITGVGAVLNFLPQLILLFFFIALLEASGYMSRIAFVLDRIFQKVGLSGKSLIPFIIGSGCSVPAIMATRTIHDENEKKMSILLTPFIPCSAKLPIITLFAGFFFPSQSGLISASLYFLAIAVILLSAFLLKKFLFKGQHSSFIQELPTYKAPDMRYVLRDTFDKTVAFITRAGSIILLLSIVIWVLISFNWRFTYGVDINESMLSDIGRAFSWVFYPMLGELSWAASVSIIQGLVAKEQVVGSMAVIAGLSPEVTEGSQIFSAQIFSFFTNASAYAFMTFNLFSAPCFGAIGAMKQELGSTKRMLKAVLFQTGVAYVLATLIYQIGHLIEVIL